MARRITLDSPSVYQQLRHDSVGEAILEAPPQRQRVPIIDVRRAARPPRVRLSELRPRPSAYLSDYPVKFQRYATAPVSRPTVVRRGQRLAIQTRLIRFANICLRTIKSHFSGFDTKKLLGWYNSPLVAKILIAMSVIIFVTGMTVSIRTFNLNNKAVSQIGATAETGANGTSDSTGDTSTEGSASNWVPSEVPVSTEEIASYAVAADLPRLITIPTIGLRTIVKHAGVDSNGAVDVPRNVFVVNWYDRGAKPGDPAGAMLLSGHFSGPRGAGAFHEIENLSNGDIIQIEQGDGTVLNFQVVEKIVYDLADTDMTKAITSADSSKLGLNLMTCDGRFDYGTRTYDQRLLIRAVKA